MGKPLFMFFGKCIFAERLMLNCLISKKIVAGTKSGTDYVIGRHGTNKSTLKKIQKEINQ